MTINKNDFIIPIHCIRTAFRVKMPEFKVLVNRPPSTPKHSMSQPGFVNWVRFDVLESDCQILF